MSPWSATNVWKPFDGVANLAEQDEPELRALRRGSAPCWTDRGGGMPRPRITLAKPRASTTNALLLSARCHERREVEERLVALVVTAAPCDASGDELDARHRHRRHVHRIHLQRARDVHLEPQRRLDCRSVSIVYIVRYGTCTRNPFDATKGSDAVNGETDLAGLHDPPLARVRVHPPRRLLARAHRDVVGVQRVVVDDRLRPNRSGRDARSAHRRASCAACAAASSRSASRLWAPRRAG